MSNWKKYSDIRGIYRNADRNDAFLYRFRDSEGKQTSVTFEITGCNGDRGLKSAVINKKHEIDERRSNEKFNRDSSMRFSDFYERYYWTNPKVQELEETTRMEYRRIFDKHLKPGIGMVRLCDFTPVVIENYFKKLDGDGMPRQMQLHIFRHLRSVFNYASNKYWLIEHNPASAPKLAPKVEKNEQKALEEDEVLKYLDAADRDGGMTRALIYFMVFTGCRRGEVAAMKWDNIDFERNEIHIRLNAKKVAGGPLMIGKTKTIQSVRTIRMPEPLKAVLLEHKKWDILGHEYVFFSSVNDGMPIAPDSITGLVANFAKKHDFGKCSPHVFRRTFSTIALRSGASPVGVNVMLGHSPNSRTLFENYLVPSERDSDKASLIFENSVKNDKC